MKAQYANDVNVFRTETDVLKASEKSDQLSRPEEPERIAVTEDFTNAELAKSYSKGFVCQNGHFRCNVLLES